MWPVIFTVGKFQLTYFGIAMFLGLFLFSFFSWRKMRFDYDEENIFAWTLLLTSVSAISGTVIYWTIYRSVGYWPMAAILIGVYILGRWSRLKNWDFWEWLDWTGWWILIIGTIGFFGWGPVMWKYGVGYLLGVFLIRTLAVNYRTIRWYKSGKPGFSGLSAIIWISIVELMVAFFGGDNKYIIGVSVRQWLAAWILTASTVVLYLRGKSID